MKIFLWLFILATGDQQKLDNGIQQYQKLLQDLIQKDFRQSFSGGQTLFESRVLIENF